MRTSPVSLFDVADWQNLCSALARASRGKRSRPEVQRFFARWPEELQQLQSDILESRLGFKPLQGFWIRDPKPRWIQAPVFRERVLHHALVAQTEARMEKSLIADTFACRKEKGCLRAVKRAQVFLHRFPWYVQTDVAQYYRSISHPVMQRQLARLFRNRGLLQLWQQIMAAYAPEPGKGLPIGALSSQHLANLYLSPLDRFLTEHPQVGGMVRYMDDLLWFVNGPEAARQTFHEAKAFTEQALGLRLHRERWQRSRFGVSWLGYRVFSNRLQLSRRRKRKFGKARRCYEDAFRAGHISEARLQQLFGAVLATTVHARETAWRRGNLQRDPAPDA
ncbi:MAG: hypothetical protein DWQ01_15955 [Planctomycetota bacterium]|nr:MAG: hypothetical protein DWQ01_15955 [Planctomycetota bacterium]